MTWKPIVYLLYFSVLRAVGDLAQVGGVFMRKYLDELLPLLLDMLNDASSSQVRNKTHIR